MSVVTNAILHLGTDSKDALAKVNEFFQGEGFISVNDEHLPKHWYGGSKFLETDIAIGAFNHLDINSFVRYLCRLECIDHLHAQLMIQEQEEGRFKLINIIDEMTPEEKERMGLVE